MTNLGVTQTTDFRVVAPEPALLLPLLSPASPGVPAQEGCMRVRSVRRNSSTNFSVAVLLHLVSSSTLVMRPPLTFQVGGWDHNSFSTWAEWAMVHFESIPLEAVHRDEDPERPVDRRNSLHPDSQPLPNCCQFCFYSFYRYSRQYLRLVHHHLECGLIGPCPHTPCTA